jgi:hypothetical protein
MSTKLLKLNANALMSSGVSGRAISGAVIFQKFVPGLAPARALTGVAVPGGDAIAALRLAPGVPASASAAPWIHLYAATLAVRRTDQV